MIKDKYLHNYLQLGWVEEEEIFAHFGGKYTCSTICLRWNCVTKQNQTN